MAQISKAKKDYLTGCYLREDMGDILLELEQERKSNRGVFSMMILDVDRFKTINDKHGHLFGDEALKYFSQMLRTNLDEYQNIAFRFGGDEFIVIFPDKSGKEVLPLARQLQENIKVQPFNLQGNLMKISFSAGVASYPQDGPTWEEVFDRADRALYFSKRAGRGRITRYGDMRKQRWIWMGIVLGTALLMFFIFILNFDPSYEDNIKKFLGQFKKTEAPLPVPTNEVRVINDSGNSLIAGEPSTELKTFYLKSGGLIRGYLQSETADELQVRPKLSSGGQGTVRVAKSNVLKIE